MTIFLVLFLISGAIGISGCTSDNGNSSNYTNTSTSEPTPINYVSPTSDNSSSSLNTSNSKQNSASSGNYVGDMNTKKFHLSSCHYVSQIKPENKIFFNSREEAIKDGYEPCKVCNP